MKQNDAQYEEHHCKKEAGARRELWKIFLVGALILFAISMILLTVQNPKWPLEIFKPRESDAVSSSALNGPAAQNNMENTVLSYVLNTLPVFPSGTEPGTLEIVSGEDNGYDLQIRVTLKETQEVVYTSPVLAPGDMQKSALLERPLLAGEYPAIADIILLDPLGSVVSTVQVDMNILVKA